MGLNLSKPMASTSDDSSTLSDHSSHNSSTTAKPAQPRSSKHSIKQQPVPHKPPHISIQPWDGSLSTRQVFVNQLRAYIHLHPTSFPNCSGSSDKMIWALSYFCGAAADVTGEYITNLIEQTVLREKEEGFDLKEWEEYQGWAPMAWEIFLESSTKTVTRKVTEKRHNEERKRNAWPMKEIRLLWRVLTCVVRWMALGLILITIGFCLVGKMKILVARNPDIVWEKEGGRLPNRGYFVAKEQS